MAGTPKSIVRQNIPSLETPRVSAEMAQENDVLERHSMRLRQNAEQCSCLSLYSETSSRQPRTTLLCLNLTPLLNDDLRGLFTYRICCGTQMRTRQQRQDAHIHDS